MLWTGYTHLVEYDKEYHGWLAAKYQIEESGYGQFVYKRVSTFSVYRTKKLAESAPDSDFELL